MSREKQCSVCKNKFDVIWCCTKFKCPYRNTIDKWRKLKENETMY